MPCTRIAGFKALFGQGVVSMTITARSPKYDPRWCDRTEFDYPITIRISDKYVLGRSVNLSRGGALIICSGLDLRGGERVSGAITIDEKSLEFDAEVVHVKPSDQSVGIMFCNLSAELNHSLFVQFDTQIKRSRNLVRDKLESSLKQLKWRLELDVITSFLFDEQQDQFHFPVAFGLKHPQAFFDPAMWPGTERAIGQAVQKLSPILSYAPDAGSAISGPFMKREQIKYSALFPIVHAKKALGIVFLSFRTERTLERRKQEITLSTLKSIAQEIWQNRDIVSYRPNAWRSIGRSVCRLIMARVNEPVAIWRVVSGTKLSLWGSSGVPKQRLIPRIEVDKKLSSWYTQITSNRILSCTCVDKNLAPLVRPNIGSMHFSNKAYIAPVKFDPLVVGIIVIFQKGGEDSADNIFRTLDPLCSIVAGGLIQHSHIARWIAQSQRELSTSLRYSEASVMTKSVEVAVTYTGADSGALLLRDECQSTFIPGSMIPQTDIVHYKNSPIIDGLMLNILNGQGSYFGRQTRRTFFADALKELGCAKSLIGVPISIDAQHRGVFYVRGKQHNQFLEGHVPWMRQWAKRTAEVLRKCGSLRNSIKSIENAVESIENLDNRNRMCREVMKQFNFDFVSLHLVDPIEGVIETVAEESKFESKISISMNSLSNSDELRDLRAHLALSDPKRIVITSGSHEKISELRSAKYRHHAYERLSVPLVILRDSKGRQVDLNWLDHWNIASQSARTISETGATPSTILMDSPLDTKNGSYLETWGVLDAGFQFSANRINYICALDVLRFANSITGEVYSTCLRNLLDHVAFHAWKSVGANSAVLIYPWVAGAQEPSTIITSGELDRSFVLANPPRSNGLGARVLRQRSPDYIPNFAEGQNNRALAVEHPKIYKQGIRSVLALPLSAGSCEGVLYIHHTSQKYFREDEVSWLAYFGERAKDAIEHATRKINERKNNQVAEVLSTFTTSLAKDPDATTLLPDIAYSSQEMFGSDVVILLEYDPSNTNTILDVATAGTFRDELKAVSLAFDGIDRRSIDSFTPEFLASDKMPLYLKEKEKLVCARRLIFQVGYERLGAIFVGYRRSLGNEKSGLLMYAPIGYTTAVAIKTRRTLRTRRLKHTLNTLDSLITLSSRTGHYCLIRQELIKWESPIKITADDTTNLIEHLASLGETLKALAMFPHLFDCRYNDSCPDVQADADAVMGYVNLLKETLKSDQLGGNERARAIASDCHDKLFGDTSGIAPRYWNNFSVSCSDIGRHIEGWIDKFVTVTWSEFRTQKTRECSNIENLWNTGNSGSSQPIIMCVNEPPNSHCREKFFFDGAVRECIIDIFSNVIHRSSGYIDPSSGVEMDMWYQISCEFDSARPYLRIEFFNLCDCEQIILRSTPSKVNLEKMGGKVLYGFIENEAIDQTKPKIAKTIVIIPSLSHAITEKSG